MLDLALFGDIQMTAPRCRWHGRDRFNKRLSAQINLRLLGRGLRFAHPDAILAALSAEIRESNVNHVILSSDATGLLSRSRRHRRRNCSAASRWTRSMIAPKSGT